MKKSTFDKWFKKNTNDFTDDHLDRTAAKIVWDAAQAEMRKKKRVKK